MEQTTKRQRSWRTRYFVSSAYQIKFIVLMLLCMLFTVAVCAFTVYFTGVSAIVEKLSNVYPQGRLVAMVNKVNLNIALNTLLLIPIIALIALYVSHKVAGPVYRIERYLTDMVKGRLTSRITLRKNDEEELVNLARKINDLTESLRLTIINERTSVQTIMAEIETIKRQLAERSANAHDIAKNIDRISEEARIVSRELSRFET